MTPLKRDKAFFEDGVGIRFDLIVRIPENIANVDDAALMIILHRVGEHERLGLCANLACLHDIPTMIQLKVYQLNEKFHVIPIGMTQEQVLQIAAALIGQRDLQIALIRDRKFCGLYLSLLVYVL